MSTIKILFIFMISEIVFELNSKNYKNTLFGQFSTLRRHGKGVSNHHQILGQLFVYKKENI